MDRQQIIFQIAEEYISQCVTNVGSADVKALCLKYDYSDLGYTSLDSMKAAVSKILRKKSFNKKKYIKNLVRSSYEKIASVEDKTKDEIIRIIQKDLQQHNLKYRLVRDYLQEMELSVREHYAKTNINRFKDLINRGHSYTYSIDNSELTSHIEKKLRTGLLKVITVIKEKH